MDAPTVDAYLVSETGPADALKVGSQLRAAGLAVDFDTEGRSVKAQFKAARRVGAPVTLVWKGSEPVDVQAEGDRVELPIVEVPAWVRGRDV